MSLKPCKFTPKGSKKELSYDEFRQYLLDNFDELVEPPTGEDEGVKESPKKKLRGTIEAFVERSDLDQETKDALLSDERSYMDALGFDEAKQLAENIISELGVEEAVSQADKNNVPTELQSLVYGEALNYAKEQGKKAETTKEKDKWADYENEIHQKLAEKATAFGRFNAYIQTIYYQSPYALVRQAKKEIEDRNKVFAPQAKKQAKEVGQILNDPIHTEEAIEEAIASAVTEAISEKEKQIKELEKKLAEAKKEPKKSSGKRRKYIVSEDAYKEAKKTLFGRPSANPYLDPQTWGALGVMAAYNIERGYYRFSDFFKKMSKETKGKYQEYFADLYESAKLKAIEDGIPASEFDSDIEQQAIYLQNEAEALKKEIEAKKQEAKEAKKWQGKGLEATIKQALIDAGYGKEVAGKQQVDWRKVTGSSKDAAPVVAKVKEALKGKIPADQIDALTEAIEKKAAELVTQKKAKAIETKIKQINRYKALKVLNKIKRNTRIQGLVETWRQGGITEKEILERLGQDFGIITFTGEDEKIIEDLVSQIDAAPTGAEKERLEESLQAFLEYTGAPQFLPRKFLERNKARLLSGPITLIKNISGGIDAAMAIAYKGLVNQFDGAKPSGDKQVVKVFLKAHKKALITAMDILWRGGIDTGTAMSEITKNKEGAPAVRYAENPRDTYKKVGAYHRAGAILDKGERVFMRVMSAFDTFNQVMLQEVEAYTFIKDELKKQNPAMSNKELAEKAYNLTYAVEINEAEMQAEKEFADRGIDVTGISGQIRFNRRVQEIVEQKRTEGTLRAAQFFGNRYTYKAYDPGLFSGAAFVIQQMKNGITKAMGKYKKSDNASVRRAAEIVDFSTAMTIDWLLPFIKTVGNILEKQMEIVPLYGMTKAAGYTAAAAYNKKQGGKLEGIDYQRAGEYYWRVAVGMALTAMLVALADDDEEDGLKSIYGEGSEQFSEKMNRGKQRPKNTIRINGNNIPIDLFGPLAGSLKIKSSALDEERYGIDQKTSVGFYLSLLNNLYFEKTGSLIDAVSSGNDRRINNMLTNEAAEQATRATIPATQFFRQAGQIASPRAKKAITFAEKLQKYSGIGSVTLDRPAIDYRGKTYDTGQIYTSSADGFIKMFSDAIKIDDVDELVFQYHPGIMAPNRSGEAFQVLTDGKYAPMTEQDFYEVSKKSGQNLDKLLSLYVKNPTYNRPEITESAYEKYYRKGEEAVIAKGKPVTEDNVKDEARKIYEEESKAEGIKNEISDLNTLAKDAAIEWYYKTNKLRVPFDKQGSIDRFEEEMAVLEQRAKKR